MVGEVGRHCLKIVVEETVGPERFNHTVQRMDEILYSDNSLLELIQLKGIKWALNVMTGIFERVGLNNNLKKKVGMSFQLYHIAGSHSDAACMQWVTF